jgi:serine/threonine protein phosphatase PrpC
VISLRWGAATDVGRLRAVNEDSVLTVEPVFAVADGMGGHAAGEVASQVALATMRERFVEADVHTTESLVQAVQDANRAIYDRSLDDLHLRGMGTTLTGIAIVERDHTERLAVVNVGDSRTYVVQDGILQQITRDHTYVEDLVAAGEITAEAARFHPRRHIITRALGIDPEVQVDAWEAPPGPGDRYLICSDGLFNEVDDGQIAAVLTGTEDPQQAADTLVRLANAAGGRDNVSVIVVDVVGEPGTSSPPVPVEQDVPADGEPAPSAETETRPGDQTMPMAALPVGLASPDGSPPVGGWVDESDAPTEAGPVPAPFSPPELPPPSMAEPKRRRRISVRSVLFVVAVLAVLGIAFGGITYYGRSGYYVGFSGDQVAVFKGQKGGVLWVKPTVDGTYSLRRSDLTAPWQQRLDDTITFTSRASADAWFETLRANPAAVPTVATTTTPATTAATATTAPPTETSTVEPTTTIIGP